MSYSMFYGASPLIFERAKALRSNLTEAESVLWEKLQKKQLLDLRFKSQHPIGKYIVDFYCHQLKLVIEIDGEVHDTLENKDYDSGRSKELHELGIEVVRFTNEEVLNELEVVLTGLEKICDKILNRKN